MNTDDLQVLAHRADDVRGRESARLAEVHDRIHAVRRRRQVGVATALVVMLVAGAAAIALLVQPKGDPDPAPPIHPSPTPTETARPGPLFIPAKGARHLTLRQTVQSYNATLSSALSSPDDPALRLSIWSTTCDRCRPTDYGRHLQPEFRAMALTRDGYRTTTYLRAPGINVPVITSPAPGVFLLADHANGEYWLLHKDGKLRPVTIVDQPRSPDDARLVFECETLTATGGAARPESAAGPARCVLDVGSATASPLPGTWIQNGDSDGDPALGQEPWGQDMVPGRGLVAWWLDHGSRRDQLLPPAPLPMVPWVGSIRGFARDDVPVYWHWRYGSSVMDLYDVPDRSGSLRRVGSRPWLPLSRAELGPRNDVGVDPRMSRTPGGGLLAWSVRADDIAGTARFTIWRAEHLTRGPFRVVYDGYFPGEGYVCYHTRLAARGGRLQYGPLVSADDGRSWHEAVSTWR